MDDYPKSEEWIGGFEAAMNLWTRLPAGQTANDLPNPYEFESQAWQGFEEAVYTLTQK